MRFESSEKGLFNGESAQKTPKLGIKTTNYLIFLVVFSTVVPVALYYIFRDDNSVKTYQHSCLVNRSYRIPCGKTNATAEYCSKISCCFDNITKVCYHYFPSKYYYESAGHFFKPSKRDAPLGERTMEIALGISEIDEDRIKIILYDPRKRTVNGKSASKKKYNICVSETTLSVDIYRLETKDLLLTTSLGPLIASNDYWEWSFQLSDQHLFGLGETLISVNENSTFTKAIYRNRRDHNTLPMFMAYKKDLFHGLIVRHFGPLEVSVLPSNLVTLKSLAGSYIELELCVGPTPADVWRQQRMGSEELLPDWVLGTHICREGNSLNLDEVLSEFDSFIKANSDLQYDSDCIHQNLWMMAINASRSQKNKLVQSVKSLIRHGKKFLLSLPPQIPVESDLFGKLPKDLFYKNQRGEIYNGTFANNRVAYPDFSSKSVKALITALLTELNNLFQLLPDGFMLVNNWPLDESFKMGNEQQFPYLSQNLIEAMSCNLPWNSTIMNELHIVRHNKYGYLQLTSLRNTSELKGVPIMTSSNHFANYNPLLIQNVNISWSNLRKTIRTVLFNSLFSSRLVSVPVCGSTTYNKKDQESLCMRWYLMASTMPLFMISSDLPRRDPKSLNSRYASNTANFGMQTRNLLLPYFKTILRANWEPIVRPMFYQFYQDENTFGLDGQYMIGNGLLIAHPLLPLQSKLKIYLPPSINWYEFWSGEIYTTNATNPWVILDIVETDWIGFISEGNIIPLIKAEDNKKSITLINAIRSELSASKADGTLFLQSSYLNFTCTENEFVIDGITKDTKLEMDCQTKPFIFERLIIYGQNRNELEVGENLCNVPKNKYVIQI